MVFFYAALFLGIVLIIIMRFAHPIFLKVFERYDDLNASVQENITNMRVVKAYVKEDHEINKFHSASYQIYKMFKKAENILIFNSPSMQLAMYGCIITISWLGAQKIRWLHINYWGAYEYDNVYHEYINVFDDVIHDICYVVYVICFCKAYS